MVCISRMNHSQRDSYTQCAAFLNLYFYDQPLQVQILIFPYICLVQNCNRDYWLKSIVFMFDNQSSRSLVYHSCVTNQNEPRIKHSILKANYLIFQCM